MGSIKGKGKSGRAVAFCVALLGILLGLWGCPDAALVLTALKEAGARHSVVYDGNRATGGTVPTDAVNYLEGQKVTVLGNTGNLVKTDHTFVGWNTKTDGSGITYTQGQTFTMGNSSVTLYAKWTAAGTGSLQITIGGLPAGANADVTVGGPDNYSQPLTGSQTLSGLTPGDYTVSAQSVTSGGVTYNAGVSGSPATVTAGSTAQANVTYSEGTGGLQVSISGLPGGANANVTVNGPNSYTQTLMASETLSGLTPGDYTVSAQSVTSGGVTYNAGVSGSPATVTTGSTTQASVTYSEGTSGLQVSIGGLPGGTNASVTVNGPNSYTQTLTASQTLSGLTPGEYTVSAQSVTSGGVTYNPGVSGSPATVTVGSTAQVSVTYSEGTGGLQVSITGLPGGTNASVTINGPNSYTQTLTASQTLSGLTPGDYTVSAQGVTSGGVTYNAGVSGSPATVTTGSTAQVSVTYTLAQPTISGFTAAPGTITQGDYSTLSWSTSNATSASIDQGIGSVPVNGNRDVNPSTTTPYTLTASNAAGTPTRTCTVYVNAQAPTGVDATDGSSTGYVRITWSGFPGNWFQVYRNTGNSNSGATWIGGWQQGTSYDDTTATPGRTYWYWVKAATDSSGNHQSGWSNSEFGWTKLSPPTNVNAADGTSTNSVAVTWGSTSGYGTIYYHVYRNTSNNRSGAQPIGNWETDTSYTDTTATPAGTTYWYWVDAAVDSSGTRSSDPGGPDTGYMHINQLTASGQHPETIKRTSSGTATVYSTSSTMFGQDDDGSTSGPLYYGFVWFDLTGLPSSCTVTGVSLSFGSLTIDCQVSNQNYSMNTNSGIITSVSYSTWTGQSASAKLGYSRDNTLATSFSYSSPPASTWTWGLGDTVIQNGPRRLVLWRFDTVSYRDLPCIIPGCDWWKCTVGGLVLRVTYSMP